ncbi:MAG: sulfatase [Spirosomataceae bacterium]
MKTLLLVCITLLFVSFDFPVPTKVQDSRPNILWISCEDMSPHLGCYGEKVAKTPHLDQLAAEGTRYTNAFTCAGVCAPSRSTIITGMFQTAIGTQHMRTLKPFGAAADAYPPDYTPYSAVLPNAVKCFSEYLRKAGYYCTNNEKQDYQFEAPVTAWDENSNKAHWRNRPAGKPFFAVFNLMVTHESQVWMRAKEPLLVHPQDVVVPPYYPDVPAVREDIARHLSNVMIMDKQAGDLLQQLKDDGLLDNTIVFFWSDHGDGLPYVKREITDRGLRVPLIVRFPDRRNAGATDPQKISLMDLGPTVLSLARIPVPSYMHGQAFLGAQKAPPRRYILAARDRMDSEYDRVRSVHDGRYQYLRNYMPEKPYYQPIRFRLQQPSMAAILTLKQQGKLNATQMRWFETKPTEELYDLVNDPYQLTNLAVVGRYQTKLQELRRVNDDWIRNHGDLSAVPEMDMVRKWWGGTLEHPPLTDEPVISADNYKVTLSCATKGASIAYKTHWKEPSWAVYDQPLSLVTGDSLYVLAHRIGYKASKVIAYIR